jgi:methyltransferase (TIGR00027 family)
MPETLRNISDTALWVAQYRVLETERPDAILRDPLARRLVEDRGERIVREMKVGGVAWPMIVRAAVMDEIILREVRGGVDCVLNLAAGLDTRPYRLDLPGSLRWIEADLPDILAYKAEKLAGETPACRLETVPVDLTDAAARRALFSSAAEGSRGVLVVSEGLLVYLTEAQVASLAADLHGQAAIRRWLVDLASARLLKWMKRRWGRHVEAANAPFRFGPGAGTKFFEPYGWREREFRSIWDESKRLGRRMRLAWLFDILGSLRTARKREEWRRFSGVVLLERAD